VFDDNIATNVKQGAIWRMKVKCSVN